MGTEIIEVKKLIYENDKKTITELLRKWINESAWLYETEIVPFKHLTITQDAFSEVTENLIGKYLRLIEREEHTQFKRILRFALLCILEEISFTRKDGQYLRWDYRSGRRAGENTFNKGPIKEFNEAIIDKLNIILKDINNSNRTLHDLMEVETKRGHIEVLAGSCLSILPKLDSNYYDILMTSPPYCNRYDYTRTYALELALLNVGEVGIRELRQNMMSCTVENRDKENLDLLFGKDVYKKATEAFQDQRELQDIIIYLNDKKSKKELNNPGIVRMVKNYFYEMSLIIYECARVLKPNAPFVMVNDNVRYAGANIPVDLILSDIAEKAGFLIDKIWILPIGKGNSSQQMGEHGREELRKCLYIWRKL